jgi:hypothetical protein
VAVAIGDLAQHAGPKLRDAAVDPRPGDFLPPSNAGVPGPEGNPHGPMVVAPELRAIEGAAGVAAYARRRARAEAATPSAPAPGMRGAPRR